MHASDATAHRLVKRGDFGADMLRFPAGGCVPDHTHVGDHILYVLGGEGWVDYDGEPHKLEKGYIYLIPSMVRHGIRADTELTLIAIGNSHRDAAAKDRLNVVKKQPA
jgi:quercetin dioxygenase-like cupin family protein